MAHETINRVGKPLDKAGFDSLVRRTLFFTPGFEIYNGICGGTAGLFDYGPPGALLQDNIVDLWKKHFVQKEKMLMVDPTIITPFDVLLTSGHVAKFSDFMCQDPKDGSYLRCDHLVEDVLEARLKGDRLARGQEAVEEKEVDEKRKKKKVKSIEAIKLDDATVKEYEEVLAKIDSYNGSELGELIKKYQIKNPATGGDVSDPVEFNLMFQTSVGPSGLQSAFLRPETAQGQFLNFAKLLNFNNGKMPFASASIGKSFRNEISPRGGILRVREFLMGEIEHFVDPLSKQHPKFDQVKHIELKLLNRHVQSAGQTTVESMPIGKAVESGVVDNETLGYFMARVQLFLLKIGIDPSKLRFRQHMGQEMAHYSSDCWDAELYCNSSWVECVGIADRSAYDLTVHMNRTKAPLVVRQKLDQPLEIEEWEVEVNKKKLGPLYKRDAKAVESAIENLSQELREKLSIDLKSEGKIAIDVKDVGNGKVELNKDLITIEKRKRVEHTREYIPNVIEPSFGIGRIMYALLEHSYWTREGDEARSVLSFPAAVAPYKVLVAGLYVKPAFLQFVDRISSRLDDLDISHNVDNSGVSIGKRYSRADELGTAYAVTVDHQSLEDATFTVRERDSTKQIRVSEQDLYKTLPSLINGTETWDDAVKRFGLFESKDEEAETA